MGNKAGVLQDNIGIKAQPVEQVQSRPLEYFREKPAPV